MSSQLIADYCQQCTFPFKQMGACPKPGVPIVYAFISLLPYLLAIFLLLRPIITKRLSHILLAGLILSAYVIADKVVKNIIQSKIAIT
jgi:hypothetical protein